MPQSLPRWRRGLVDAARIGDLLVRDITVGRLTLHAMSLVYTSLLSLVPMIAVSFSVLKAFGAHNQMEPLLLNLFLPLGERGPELTTEIIGFVDNIQVGVLGSLGLVFLLYMVVSLIQKIEAAFNEIWHVPASRYLIQRAANYLAVLLVGPVLMFTAMGTVASLLATDSARWLLGFELLESAYAGFTGLVPYLFVTAAFAFIYVFIPNTRVRFASAVVGAVFAGFAWATVGWIFARFVAASTQYTAIYSGFAIVIVAMIWVYIAWLILLVGASIAYYHQYRGELRLHGIDARLGGRMREVLALMVMRAVGRRFYRGGPPLTADGLAMELGAPRPELALVINALVRAGLLSSASEPPGALLPGRPLDTTRVDCVLAAVREDPGERDCAAQPPVAATVPAFLSALMQDIEHATRDACSDWTLKRLALEDESAGAPEPTAPDASPNPETRNDGDHAR